MSHDIQMSYAVRSLFALNFTRDSLFIYHVSRFLYIMCIVYMLIRQSGVELRGNIDVVVQFILFLFVCQLCIWFYSHVSTPSIYIFIDLYSYMWTVVWFRWFFILAHYVHIRVSHSYTSFIICDDGTQNLTVYLYNSTVCGVSKIQYDDSFFFFAFFLHNPKSGGASYCHSSSTSIENRHAVECVYRYIEYCVAVTVKMRCDYVTCDCNCDNICLDCSHFDFCSFYHGYTSKIIYEESLCTRHKLWTTNSTSTLNKTHTLCLRLIGQFRTFLSYLLEIIKCSDNCRISCVCVFKTLNM